MNKKLLISVAIFGIIAFFIASYFYILSNHKETLSPNSKELQKIKIEITDLNRSPDGLFYSLKLKNSSSYVIKQNVVYLSFPIISENSYKQNPFKIEIKGNKLNIKSGEVIMLNCFIPDELVKSISDKSIQAPILEIKGYIDEVSENNYFQNITEAK